MTTESTQTKPAGRKVIDWEAVEIQYRAGIRSLKDIGAQYGVSDAGILKRAKRDGWERDLRAKIQAKADAKVSAAAVSDEVRARTKTAEREVVEANAQAVADIRLAHRRDIHRARRITNALLEELEQQTDPATLAMLQELGELMREPDDNGQDRRNDLYMKVITLAERSKTMKTLAESMRSLVDMERTAFGMDKEAPPDDGFTKFLKSIGSGAGGSAFQPVARDPEHDEG